MVDRPYFVQILEKDYGGGVQSIVLAGTPCLPNYQTDDMRAPVRGSSCTVNILNSGSTPLTTFYSINDDQFLVKVLQGMDVLWIGYVVQDDSTELMVDYTHEITLQCNDGLGLLKDVAFNKNPTVLTADAFYTRQTFAAILHQCLANTNLELNTAVFMNLWENRMVETDSFLPQAQIDCQTFISGETFMSCYDVLTRILDRFNASLFQAQGRWNIVRWDELYTLTTAHAFTYDSTWNLIGSALLDTPFIAMPNVATAALPGTFPENGLRRQIVRPFQFDRETFNYVQPKYLLRNYDLHELGPLIRTYADGPNQVSEYTWTGWGGGWGTNPTQRFIRVTVDALQNEISRYAVGVGAVDDPVTGAPRAISGTPFEISQGDKVKFTFSFRHSFARSGPLNIFFAVRLYDGVNERYVGNQADFDYVGGGTPWVPVFVDSGPLPHGFFYQIVAGDTTGEWHTVEIESAQAPFDGLLTCFLGQSDGTGGPFSGETQYRDIRMEYTPFINDSTKITGHIHKDEQTISSDIKNNEDVVVYIDDSPRNSILGTIYLNTSTGVVQDRTAFWHRAGYVEARKLGQIMTTETLQWRSVPRCKLEGTFYGLVQGGIHVSMLSIFVFSYLAPSRFIFGQFELDTRTNSWRGTAWELDSNTGAVAEIYTFNYIYSTQ